MRHNFGRSRNCFIRNSFAGPRKWPRRGARPTRRIKATDRTGQRDRFAEFVCGPLYPLFPLLPAPLRPTLAPFVIMPVRSGNRVSARTSRLSRLSCPRPRDSTDTSPREYTLSPRGINYARDRGRSREDSFPFARSRKENRTKSISRLRRSRRMHRRWGAKSWKVAIEDDKK